MDTKGNLWYNTLVITLSFTEGSFMSDRQRMLVWRCIISVFIAATLFFIWSNSLADAPESTVRSDGVIEWLKPIVDPQDKIDEGTFTFAVRKTAHFTEFAVLGGEIFLLLSTFGENFPRRLRRVPPSGLLACGVAVIDEILQLFSPGRACRVTDMMIDTTGALTGALVLCGITAVIGKIRGRVN